MSATTYDATLDVSGTSPIPLSRLIKVEMRKMGDTRAGKWLLITVAVVAVLVTASMFIWGSSKDRTFLDLLSFAGIPLTFMLPVLGILLITQEWGQRTALVTFTLSPHRDRVLLAKVVAALLFALSAIVIASIPAALLTLVSGADHPWQDLSVAMMAKILLAFAIGIVWGLAFGAAFLNSAFAIVLYFVIPTIISIIGGIWTSVGDKLIWIDLNQSSSALYDTDPIHGDDWAHMVTGFLLWIALPGVIGAWRVLRAEVK